MNPRMTSNSGQARMTLISWILLPPSSSSKAVDMHHTRFFIDLHLIVPKSSTDTFVQFVSCP